MNFFKKIFFMQASPLIEKAKNGPIEQSDMLLLPDHIDPRSTYFPEEELNFSSSFAHLFSVLKISRSEIKVAYSWYFASVMFSLSTPLLVNRFVTIISKGVNGANLNEALLTGTALGFCGFMTGFSAQHYFARALGAYQIVTNVLNRVLFKHSLQLSMGARGRNQVGDIVNYMSSDSDAIADFTFVFGELVSNILMIIGVIIMLFTFLGTSAIAALIAFFSLVPLTRYVARKFSSLEEEMMSHRDKRVTLMTQAMNAIRVVKYFAWESSIEKEVMDIRDKELSSRKKLARSEVLSGLAYMAISTVVLFIALATHALRHQPIDAALIFTCVSLFGLIEGPFGDLSHVLSRLTNGHVGAGRLIKFLNEEKKQKVTSSQKETQNALELENISAYFTDVDDPVLQNISFQLKQGESLAIVGPVGSGKSALLYTILNEIKIKEGEIYFKDRPKMAYLPQEAYIINSSMRENILFGEDASEEKIHESLNVSCLDKDMAHFKGGLYTEIGEKGVNLSGGQKQRVGLARAYLSDPELVLLDDPLSAVDHETEKELCERLLFGKWKDKTRVVVTHRLEHLARFDKVLFLEKGTIAAFGTFDEIIGSSKNFQDFYAEHSRTENPLALEEKEVMEDEEVKKKTQINAVRITEDEDREVGAIKKRVYLDYLRSLGGTDDKLRPYLLALLVLGAIFVALAPLLQRSWLTYFSNHQDKWSALSAIGIYGIIGLLVLVLSLLNNFFWLDRGIKAGKNMHDSMLKSVLKAPVRFFDSTPVGRIIQRFSRDVESVDIYLQWSFVSVVNSLLQIIVSVTLILTLLPYMIVVIVPVLYIYYLVQKYYRAPAREAKRFDSVARSPRYSLFKETLQGLIVIRSFGKEDYFLESFYDKLKESQRMFYSHYMLNRWFSSRIPLIGGIISIGTTVAVAFSAYYGVINAGTAGLVTLYSLSFWGHLNWGVRMYADIETRMTSVERLKFFAQIPPEKDVISNEPGPKENALWPTEGKIEIKDIKVRYAAHLPLVLKGISFTIRPGERVGIIGRTGSGKSTLFQTLFRFIELESGEISIDGVNIASVPLNKLRKSMAIIPQDPALFLGTVRNNLDRYNEYDDTAIERVLRHSGLWNTINELPQGIYTPVAEGGNNFSQGQRQLLCLARALLINARIIIMDEATASVDVQTDMILKKVIREELKGITMLIIAHRLKTVSDCDQIIEINQGEARTVKR